jgi:protein-disulfide isomerase
MTRSRAVERREEREAEKRRQQRTLVIIGIVVTLVIIAILVFLVTQPAEAPIPETAAARYADLQQTRTSEGYPRLGDPLAPVEVKLYSNLSSPNASAFHTRTIDGLIERVRGGSVQLVFVPTMRINQTEQQVQNGLGAMRAGLCAAEQGRFWVLVDTFYDWATRYGNQSFTNNRIVAGLNGLGINQGDYSTCLGSSRPADTLNAAETEIGTLQNFNDVPTLAIRDVVPLDEENVPIPATDVDALLARLDAAIAESLLTPEVAPEAVGTDEVTPEGTATDETTPEATSEATDSATAEATSEAGATDAPTAEATGEPTTAPTQAATRTPRATATAQPVATATP